MSGGEKHGPYKYRVYREGEPIKKSTSERLIAKVDGAIGIIPCTLRHTTFTAGY